jgi:small GTP-binding protein
MIQKKICMVGAYGAGKTSLVRRFVESMFDERYHTTVGARIDKKVVKVNAASIMMMIWDLAGGDETESTRLSHLRGANGYIIVVDGCRPWTLERGEILREQIVQSFGDLPYAVAMNKSDLRAMWEFESKDMASWENVFITSAKTGDSVESMFKTLAIKML